MNYIELIELMEIGHEIVGKTNDGLYFGALNIEEGYCNIIIGDRLNEIIYKVPYGQIEESLKDKKIYKNMTYRQLLDNEIILIDEVY